MSIEDRTAIWMADKLAELVKENDQLRADLKVLSEAVLESHTTRYFTTDAGIMTQATTYCQCPACEISRKYLTKGEAE